MSDAPALTADQWVDVVVAYLDQGFRLHHWHLINVLRIPKDFWPKVRYRLQRDPRVTYIGRGYELGRWKTEAGDERWQMRRRMDCARSLIRQALKDLVLRPLGTDRQAVTCMLDLNHAYWEMQDPDFDPLKLRQFLEELGDPLRSLTWKDGNDLPYWLVQLTDMDAFEERAVKIIEKDKGRNQDRVSLLRPNAAIGALMMGI